MQIAFPFQIRQGRVATVSEAEHLRQLIEQLLLTFPGQRVNRPDFGAGVQQLVFESEDSQLLAALRHTLQASLQRYLGNLITVEGIEVATSGSELSIAITFRDDQRTQTVTVQV